MPDHEHPFGWLSLLPPLTAIVLAIITRRVVVSLLLGIFIGAMILTRCDLPTAIAQTCDEHLWHKLIDSDTLHVFFFTILMGTMVGMINRAAGMRGLVNALTPMASNRTRGQITTWFLGLFVFFDDYANTMLLGNTLRPLTDRLKIAREKLAYLVDSTAAPVAGLALISTWVAGEIDYVQTGINSLPVDESWNAFAIFVQSIPYRFYVLFALLFVPIVALLRRDFGPMLKAEQAAVAGVPGKADPASLETAGNTGSSSDPTAPDPSTPARWYNAVVPVVVTVGAVIYFLYTSGAEATDSKKLMDIFGSSSSYTSLLWGALWGAASAYVMIVAQRLIPLRDLHQAAADGARMMIPALIILWLAQSMSGMTRHQDLDQSHQPVVAALIKNGSDSEAIMRYLINDLEPDRQAPAKLLDSLKAYVANRYKNYVSQLDDELKMHLEAGDYRDSSELSQWMSVIEKRAFRELQKDLEPVLQLIAGPESFQAYVEGLATDADRKQELTAGFEFCNQFLSKGTSEKPLAIALAHWRGKLETGDQVIDVLKVQPAAEYPTFEYKYLYREKRLYTGDFLSGKLADLRQGNGFLAENFVKLLPTLVFVLASIVAFSTGTSWGTMGIVMPIVIELTYSQLVLNGESVASSDPILLCCVGSVLAGAIFGDHCSPISDTTVLSSQASGCNHIAHVRTQLPYAILVGLVAIVFGTLPIGWGIPVWLMLPLGIAAMVGILYLVGTPVPDPGSQEPDDDRRE